MRKITHLLLVVVLGITLINCNQSKNTPKQETQDLSMHDLGIKEWKAMRFGMFIHWGIYSVPAGVWKGKQIEKLGEQIQRHAYIPSDEYEALAKEFNPVNFDADAVVKLAKSAGMRYIVLTTKHHDGFCMFESEHTDFDIVDASPYKKDILKELADACRNNGLKLGMYYSTPDWHFNRPNPEVNPDDGKISVFGKVSKANEDYQVAQLKELMTNYGDVVELFFDMGEPTAAQSKRFATAVHSVQPKCMINGRVMNNQGDFLTMPDNHVPDVPIDTLAWETPGTFYHTWGHKSWVKGDPVMVQVKNQIRKLSQIVARGGNFLLNIGPKSDGSVLPYEKEVLTKMGDWVHTNSEAIFDTKTTPFKKLDWGECTYKEGKLYFHVFDWPKDGKLLIPGLNNTISKAYMLGSGSGLNVENQKGNVVIDLTSEIEDPNLTIVVAEYEGDLAINHPMIRSAQDDVIKLSEKDATHHGKYGRESYRSILKDYYRSWDVEIKQPGKYEVVMNYKMRYDFKKFVLESNGEKIEFVITGNGVKKEKAILIDGNEEVKVKLFKTKGKYKSAIVGTIQLNKVGRNVIYLKPGVDFEFKTTTKEFKQQDQKYRGMNIDIESIDLIYKE